MRYASACSGIEAATVGWHGLGWEPVWFSEIEPFPCRLLEYYYPWVPNLGDMLNIENEEYFRQSAFDLLVAGTPCQSFSIAGLRGGLSTAGGNLALEFCRILAIKRPKWFLWENVPGVFSVDGGRAFGSILRGFRECGYSCAWRVLDAQFFGVPQRRRRVFVVGYLGNDWRPPAAVLFEPKGLRRDYSPGGESREDVTGTLGRRTGGRSIGAEEAAGNQIIVMSTAQANAEITENIVPTLNRNHGQPIYFEQRVGRNGRGMPDSVAAPLKAKSGETGKGDGAPCIIYDGAQITSPQNRQNPQPGDPAPVMAKNSRLWSLMPMNSGKDFKARVMEVTQPLTTKPGVSCDQGGDIVQTFQSSQSGVRLGDTHATLDANNGPRRHNGVFNGSIIRRLTPLECERLQGFPDHYTAIPGAADTPRYESLGNSMATVVMRWLGQQIDYYDKIFDGIK